MGIWHWPSPGQSFHQIYALICSSKCSLNFGYSLEATAALSAGFSHRICGEGRVLLAAATSFPQLILLKHNMPFFNSSYFNTWPLLSSHTTFWPQEQTNKQLPKNCHFPSRLILELAQDLEYGQTLYPRVTHPFLCKGDDSCPKSHSLNKISTG